MQGVSKEEACLTAVWTVATSALCFLDMGNFVQAAMVRRHWADIA